MANPAQPRYTGFPYGIGAPGQDEMQMTNPLSLPQTATKVIYTITGGPILVVGIWGVVTTAIGAVANATKLTATPTVGGAATDICATVDINGAAAGDIYTPVQSFGIAAALNTAGVLQTNGTTVNLVTQFVMTPGTILVNCAGSDGGAGRIQWYMRYIPMGVGFSTLAGATQAGAPSTFSVVTSPLS